MECYAQTKISGIEEKVANQAHIVQERLSEDVAFIMIACLSCQDRL